MDTRSVLARHPIFSRLSADAQTRLAQHATLTLLDTGDCLSDDPETWTLLLTGILQTAHGALSPGDLLAPATVPAPYALTACSVLRWPSAAQIETLPAAHTQIEAQPMHAGVFAAPRSLPFAAVTQAVHAALDVTPWLILGPLVDHCLLYRDASLWPVLAASLGIVAMFGLAASILHGTLITPLAMAWATAMRRRTISAIYHSAATPHVSPAVERWWNRLRTTLRAIDQLQQHGALWVHEACHAGLALVVLLVLSTKLTAFGIAALAPLALWRMFSGRLPVNAAHELFGLQLFRTLHTLLILALCVQAVRTNTLGMGRMFSVLGLWLGAWDSSMHLLPLRALPTGVRRRSSVRAQTSQSVPRLHVTLDGVSATYPGTDVPALRNVSLDLLPGSAVGIVGRSGAGKSTLARLIYGTLTPDAGAVTCDGFAMQTLAANARREQLAWVDAHAFLPHPVPRDNLTLGAHTAHLERLTWACALCEVSPDTADTSDATRSRLALARAMMRRPRLLVLDDVLRNFAPDERKQLVMRLRTAAPDMTLVVLTCAPQDVQALPEVVILDAGRIVSRGAPSKLLTSPGLFSYLHAEHAA